MTQCASKCSSKQHKYEINCVVKNGNVDEAKAYILTCSNPFRGADKYGRNLLHVASANGKNDIITWLVEKAKGTVNTKDKESGWSSLHRALFYGQITSAVNLCKNGASLTVKDNDDLTPLDICTKDRCYMPFVQRHCEIADHNVFTWGDNSSYTLGHGKESRVLIPEIVETFRKRETTIKKVLMRRYHCVFLTDDGVVFSCGHGRGGRLGLGHEEPILFPQPMKLPGMHMIQTPAGSGDSNEQVFKVLDIAAARDHTLLLASNGKVYVCGMNDHKQLGISPDSMEKLREPRAISTKGAPKGEAIEKIAAGRFHSVIAFKTSVYTCGLNAGQLGHAKGEKYCINLRVVSSLLAEPIHMLEACDAATIVVPASSTREGFYILYNYGCRFINFRGAKFSKKILRLSASGGKLDHLLLPELLNDKGGSVLRIAWINDVGQLLIWTEDCNTIRKITYSSLGRQLFITDVASSMIEMLVTTDEGGAYILTHTDKTSHAPIDNTKFGAGLMSVMDLKIKRVAGAHRATQCSIDSKSTNYALLQAKEFTCMFAEVGDSHISDEFGDLYKSADQLDGISDVILIAENQQVPAHKYILASRCPYFRKLLINDTSTPQQISADDDYDDIDIPEPTYALSHDPSHAGSHDSCDQAGHSAAGGSTSSMDAIEVDCDIKTLMFVLHYIYTDQVETNLLIEQIASASADVIESQKTNKKSNKSKQNKRSEETTKLRSEIEFIANKFKIKQINHRYQSGKKSAPVIHFSMTKHPQWFDMVLVSSDNKEIKAHKCVLVARMEYFRTMLTGHWFEGLEREVRLELPIPADILQALLQFIYTDDYSHLQAKNDVEFIVNMMVVADQLLLSRLKQTCEQIIESMLTISNVVQVYELADTYHSVQLKEAAQFMICMNLAEMVEASLLNDLNDDLLEQLTRYYRNSLRCMSRRFLSRYTDGPSQEEIDRAVAEASYSQHDVTSSSPSVTSSGSHHSVPTKRTRRRTRTNSHSSTDSDKHVETTNTSNIDFTENDFTEEFSSEQYLNCPEEDNSKDDISISIKAISINQENDQSSARRQLYKDTRERIQSSSEPDMPLKSPSMPQSSQSPKSLLSPTIPQPSLRDIMAQELKAKETKDINSSKHKTKPIKRRQYRSIDSPTEVAPVVSSNLGSAWTPTSPISASGVAWVKSSSVASDHAVTSFRDLMKREESKSSKSAVSAADGKSSSKLVSKTPTMITTSKPNVKSGASHNVWMTPNQLASPTKPFHVRAGSNGYKNGNKSANQVTTEAATANHNLHAIMKQEASEMEALMKSANKPLSLVQIEERAIGELTQRYKATCKAFEVITVERVTRKSATPIWCNQSEKR